MNARRFVTVIYLCNFVSYINSKPTESNTAFAAEHGLDLRIVGGKQTHIEDFPFVVSVQRRYQRHLCGGTYILPKFILSAAHCMVSSRGKSFKPINPRVFVAVAGSTKVKSLYGSRMQIKLITRVLPHPLYNPKNMHHDIGLYQSGYGDVLRQVQVPLVTMEKCRFQVHPSVNEDSQLCAGIDEGGVDSCQGDSGGPMLCDNVQVGVVSWGIGCGNKRSPGIYSRVDYYLDWINHTVVRNTSPSSRDPDLIFYHLLTLFLYFF